jgi:hypothetical protein
VDSWRIALYSIRDGRGSDREELESLLRRYKMGR